MKILVCGGRDYNDYARLEDVLNYLHNEDSISHVIHGAAVGADTLAGRWAREKGIQEVRCPANWDMHGKKAGYLRNAAMKGLGPDLVVAFPGGRGTEMMIKLASESDIEVMIIEDKEK